MDFHKGDCRYLPTQIILLWKNSIFYRPDLCYWAERTLNLQFQLLLTDYLDIQNSNTVDQQTSSGFTDQSSNINTFFNRRKLQTYDKHLKNNIQKLTSYNFAFPAKRRYSNSTNRRLPTKTSRTLKSTNATFQTSLTICNWLTHRWPAKPRIQSGHLCATPTQHFFENCMFRWSVTSIKSKHSWSANPANHVRCIRSYPLTCVTHSWQRVIIVRWN